MPLPLPAVAAEGATEKDRTALARSRQGRERTLATFMVQNMIRARNKECSEGEGGTCQTSKVKMDCMKIASIGGIPCRHLKIGMGKIFFCQLQDPGLIRTDGIYLRTGRFFLDPRSFFQATLMSH